MRRLLPWLVAGAGVALLVAGLLVFRTGDSTSWVAYTGSYAPLLPDDAPAYESTLALSFDDAVLWTGRHVTGAALGLAGLLLLAALAGWAVGRRTGPRTSAAARPEP